MKTLDLHDIWRRFRRGVLVALGAAGRGLTEFYNSSNLTFASSVAYYSLLSIFPFILLVSTILSKLAVIQAGSEQRVINLLDLALPRNFEFLSDWIVDLQRAPLEFTIAGTLLTLWASMGVFGAITSAVNHAWGVERQYNFFKHKLVAFLMLLAAGLVFAFAVFMVGAARASEQSWFATVYAWFPWLTKFTAVASRYAFMGSTVVGIGLIYYFLPNTKVRLRDVWFGAVLAAMLWHGALTGFGWYLSHFGRLGVQGTIGAVIAFLIWVYISAIILLYGVEVTASYSRLRIQAEADPEMS